MTLPEIIRQSATILPSCVRRFPPRVSRYFLYEHYNGLIIQKIEDVPTAGKTVAECAVLLRANGSPKVRLELVNPERKETNTVELTRGKFLTSG